ncbi:IS5 family transposase [Dolichospermum sp. ST_sed3]|nr:IS5 family transposase [Dolichospermum sp. ST_sed3]
MRYETVKNLTDKEFKRSTGVHRPTFDKMLAVIQAALRDFGRPPTLSRADQLLLALMYWREYRTEFHIGLTYGVSEATVCRTIQKVENALLRSRQFRLPGKKVLHASDTWIKVVLIDATEQPIERPKKKQGEHYSGKKKRHTQKAQVIVNRQTKAILATAFAKGQTHDFQLFKDSRSPISEQIRGLGDAGYQGLVGRHANSQTPFKKSKHHPLTQEQKTHNRRLSRERILVEHVIRSLKIFRILSERYRNRRKRFGLRFNLIAGLYNSELETP